MRAISELVCLSQTSFSLPWLVSAFVIARVFGACDGISYFKILLGVAGFISARASAMCFNRWLDCDIDRQNPRTAGRALPAGQLLPVQVFWMGAATLLFFWLSTAAFGKTCLVCALVTSPFMIAYSLCKRFTWASHLVLGGVQAMLPITVGVAVTGNISAEQILLGLGLGCNVAAMDVLYAVQDRHLDREQGLFSIPALFGLRSAIRWARALHVLTLIFLVYAGLILHLAFPYFVGLFALAVLYIAGHLQIMQHRSLSKRQFAAGNWLVGTIVLISLLGALAWESM